MIMTIKKKRDTTLVLSRQFKNTISLMFSKFELTLNGLVILSKQLNTKMFPHKDKHNSLP